MPEIYGLSEEELHSINIESESELKDIAGRIAESMELDPPTKNYHKFIRQTLLSKPGLAFDTEKSEFRWNPDNFLMKCAEPEGERFTTGSTVTIVGGRLDKSTGKEIKPHVVEIARAVDGNYLTADRKEISPEEFDEGVFADEDWSRFDEYKERMNDLLGSLPGDIKRDFSRTVEARKLYAKVMRRSREMIDPCTRKRFVAVVNNLLGNLDRSEIAKIAKDKNFKELYQTITSNVQLEDGSLDDILERKRAFFWGD